MSCKKISLYFLLISHLLSFTLAATYSSDILYDIYPYVRVYKNGTVERFIGTQTLPPSLDPINGVRSKDIYGIAPKLNVSARLYLPKNTVNPKKKLPLLVYFHGGAFFTESAFSPTYYNHMNSLVAKANVVAVSVNYRLAPENPLPIGYEDSWLALKWVFSHSEGGNGTDPWLKSYVDYGRVYLGGDSAGANIAHNMAIRAGLDKTGRVKLLGMFLNCPHFWGKKLIGSEGDGDPQRRAVMESIWIHAYPNSTGFDDPLSNPAKDPNLSKMDGKRVLVYVAEKDILKDRGLYYKRTLRRSKWNGIVKAVEVKGEDHVFNLRFPNTTKAMKMLNQLASFLNRD
ncbi:hypothetical protein ABFX02_02G032100 [Erythranthe guttata]